MTTLIVALASFVLLGTLVMVVPPRHENRLLAVLTIMGVLCLYMFVGVLLGG